MQSETADVLSYMIEMGVDPGLLQLTLRYESWEVRYLSSSEMQTYRVVTVPWSESEQQAGAASTQEPIVSRQPPPKEPMKPLIGPEDARGGLVRREKGYAVLMVEPSTQAREIRVLENGTRVKILGTADRWYRVAIDYGQNGWLHQTWVKVDEFYDGRFEGKHVQIKSFDNLDDVQSFLLASPLNLDAYLAANAWFAINLDGTFTDVEAAQALSELKSAGRIPSDSFQTYGNTYTNKICCE